jgi:ACR3 family arsenite efflux pump ArsB
MRRDQIRKLSLWMLGLMVFFMQLANGRHVFIGLRPYHHEFALPMTLVFVLTPFAAILADTFKSNATDPRNQRVILGVAALTFASELWANLSVGAWEAHGDNQMITEIARLFTLGYSTTLFLGAVAYSMMISLMTALLVWALAKALRETLGIEQVSTTQPHTNNGYDPSRFDRLQLGHASDPAEEYEHVGTNGR